MTASQTPPTIQDAARVLMAHSLDAARNLGVRPTSSPIYQTIYNRMASQVLADPALNLTPQERTLVAQFITLDSQDETRSVMLRVRLTESERTDLQRMADAAGLEVSEYVRRRVFGE